MAQKNVKKPAGNPPICVRLDPTLFARIETDANEHERSKAAQVRLIVKEYYAERLGPNTPPELLGKVDRVVR